MPKNIFEALPDRLLPAARRLSIRRRLAVLLHRGHESPDIPGLDAAVQGDALELRLPAHYLEDRPLLQADLAGEPADIGALGITLRVA